MPEASIKQSKVDYSDIKTTRDAFHRGDFEVFQVAKSGHRAGMDALLLGASLPENASGYMADIGSNSGTAAFAALANNEGLRAQLIDNDPIAIHLAKESLALPANKKFFGRITTIEADVSLSGDKRTKAGLFADSVDFAIMNPPYNQEALRASPNETRAGAHVMGFGGLDAWVRTAVAMLKPGGVFSLIYRTENLGEVIACCQGRFGGLCVLPIHSKADEAAKRIIVRATKGSRAPLTIVPGIVMHDDDSKTTEVADAVLNGRERLNFGEK